jgi:hypothetical protein
MSVQLPSLIAPLPIVFGRGREAAQRPSLHAGPTGRPRSMETPSGAALVCETTICPRAAMLSRSARSCRRVGRSIPRVWVHRPLPEAPQRDCSLRHRGSFIRTDFQSQSVRWSRPARWRCSCLPRHPRSLPTGLGMVATARTGAPPTTGTRLPPTTSPPISWCSISPPTGATRFSSQCRDYLHCGDLRRTFQWRDDPLRHATHDRVQRDLDRRRGGGVYAFEPRHTRGRPEVDEQFGQSPSGDRCADQWGLRAHHRGNWRQPD